MARRDFVLFFLREGEEAFGEALDAVIALDGHAATPAELAGAAGIGEEPLPCLDEKKAERLAIHGGHGEKRERFQRENLFLAGDVWEEFDRLAAAGSGEALLELFDVPGVFRRHRAEAAQPGLGKTGAALELDESLDHQIDPLLRNE